MTETEAWAAQLPPHEGSKSMDNIDTSTEAVERLLENVVPGPWVVGPVDDTSVFSSDGSEVAMIDGDYNEPDLWPIMEANARFIAAARDLVPALLKERDEARAKLAGFEAMTMLDFANYLTAKSLSKIRGADHE